MKQIFLTAVLALQLVACSQDSGESVTAFTLDSFERTTVPDAAGTVYRNDSLLLGNPQTIRFHPDGYLVLLDRTDDGQVTVIDLETDNVQHLIRRGRGPEEVMIVRDLVVHDGDIWISGLAERKILKLTRPAGSREFEAHAVCTVADQFMRAVPVADGRFLTLASPSSQTRFHLLDSQGAPCDTVGSFPALGQLAETTPSNAIFQSEITVSPDGGHIAAVCQSLEFIDIYDADMTLIRRLQGPQGIDPSVKTIKTPVGVSSYLDPMYFIFSGAVSNDRQFMVGYIGVCVQNESDFGEQVGSVLSFDWKGRPQKAYDFESDIVSFDMDWKNNVMYCIENRPEPEIVAYRLDDLK